MNLGKAHPPVIGGYRTSRAGPRSYVGLHGNMHYGYDIGYNPATAIGQPIYSIYNGVVKLIRGSGLNRYVVIDHGSFDLSYHHNSRIVVRIGQRVKSGQKIAEMGTAGTGPHLHVELHVGNWFNPSVSRINNLIDSIGFPSTKPSGGSITPAQPPVLEGPVMSAEEFWDHNIRSAVSGDNIKASNMLRNAHGDANSAPSRVWNTENSRTGDQYGAHVRRADPTIPAFTSRVSGNRISEITAILNAQEKATEARNLGRQNRDALTAIARTLDEVLNGQGKILSAVESAFSAQALSADDEED